MRWLLLTLITHLSIGGYGQQYVGLSTSNHSGGHGLYINPASITGGKIGFYLNFMAADVFFNNSYLRYESTSSFPSFMRGGSFLNQENFRKAGISDESFFSTAIEVRGPGILIRLNDKNAFAITTRYRALAQGNYISGGIADLMWAELNSSFIDEGIYKNEKLQINSDILSELALTYALTIWQSDKHSIKVGATAKRVHGHYAAHADFKNLSYQANTLPDHYTQLNFSSLDAHYGYSGYNASGRGYREVLFMQNFLAQGWAGDVGIQYEYFGKKALRLQKADSLGQTPKLYKVKVGFVITDIGKLTYQDAESVRAFQLNRQNVEFATSRFEGASWQDTDILLYDVFNVQSDDMLPSLTVHLPRAINLNVDYRFSRRLYCNLLLVNGLGKDNAFAIKQFGYLSLIPRFESRGLEFGVPLTLHNQYKELSFGAMLRLGPLIVGSANIFSALGIKEAYDANLYAAFVIPAQVKPKK